MQGEQRPPRVLWANAYCLLDTSSGASVLAREMLRQLRAAGCEVQVLGATVFDHPRGNERLKASWDKVSARRGKFVSVNDPPLTHHLLVTADTARSRITPREELIWFNAFQSTLDRFRPDVILYYGGQVLDMLMTAEARSRGIKIAAILVNGNYSGKRWCQDADLILTDSHATARRYAEQDGLTVTPLGGFIVPERVIAARHSRRHVLFVNPSPEKGAVLVCMLAMLMEQTRPDIVFEVVESRGNWAELLQQVSKQLGTPRDALNNVVLTPNTPDMRPVYGRARILLAPSLCWESFGLVAAEAILNHIPVVHSGSGGLAEVVGGAGLHIRLPEEAHKPPYSWAPNWDGLKQLATIIERLYDDEAYYQSYMVKAAEQAGRHSLGVSTGALLDALGPLFKQQGVGLPNVSSERIAGEASAS